MGRGSRCNPELQCKGEACAIVNSRRRLADDARIDSLGFSRFLGAMKRSICILSRSWRPGSVIIAGT
jgi:hypothetical protein